MKPRLNFYGAVPGIIKTLSVPVKLSLIHI